MPSSRISLWVSIAIVVVLALISSSSDSLSSSSHASSSSSSSLFPSLLSVSGAPARRKLSEKELNEIEDQWMEDEEEDDDDAPFKFKKGADGTRMPPQPTTKTEMGFVTLKGTPGRKKTDEMASKWSDMMLAAGIDVRGYTIEDNRILFVCDQRGYKDMNRVRGFLLKQPDTLEFEWNNKKSVPGDVPADEEGEVKDPLAKFQAMQDEQAALAKRAARAKKKAEEAKKKKERLEKERKEKAEKQRKKAAELAKKKQEEEAAAAAAQNLKTDL